MQKRKSFFNNELEQRFSLRKYTIGLCSVCLGFVVIGMGNQTVKADTVNDVEKSSAVQENKVQDTNSSNADALTESKPNTLDSVVSTPNTTPTETKENETGSVVVTAPKTNTTLTGSNANEAMPTETKLDKANTAAANSNNALAQTKLVKAESAAQPKANGTSTETKPNEHGSAAADPNVVSTEVKPGSANPASLAKIKLQKMRLAKLVDTKALTESKVATDNQFNFDDWDTEIYVTSTDDAYLNITGYKGDRSKQIIVPNGADFAKAGKNDENLQVEIDKNTLADLIVDGVAPKLSNTDGQKIVAKGNDWTEAFSNKDLHDISGLANLDTSNVTSMRSMFWSNRISDLSPLANWNTGNVTDMDGMFIGNLQISDLSPLANWDTTNVTDMDQMFWGNRISDLSPLANWNTSNVTNMSSMFDRNQISDLSPLANWNIGNVTNMDSMFDSNRISDLSPLANWNISNVTNMGSMFWGNQISNLSPLANWNTGHVTNMSYMFKDNKIIDLNPLSNWNTGNVTNMDSMFFENPISDLSPLANWNTGKVTNMNCMFQDNHISDLSPLANWNTGKVAKMSGMFNGNRISNLSPLANWNTGNVTLMDEMFQNNQISDLSPLANWNTGNVIHMDEMFQNNRISDLSPLVNWNTGNVTSTDEMFKENPLNITINSQSILNKFHTSAYKFDNTGTLASHSESKTFNDGSQILLDKNIVTNKDLAILTFKANNSTGNTYQIKIFNPNKSIDIQAAPLPTALGTTDTSYQDGYTIITNKFINNGSVSQNISIAPKRKSPDDMPDFAQYESTSGLITVAKNKEDLGSINITYQNVSNISDYISAPYIGKKPYVNHTQNTFYFEPKINYDSSKQYSFIKSAGLTITVPDDVTIDPDTFIDAKNGKTLKATKLADNQYQVVLNNTTDGIAVKGLIDVSADKLANGTAHLPGFGMKYTINTYNDKVVPVVATGTSKELSVIPDLASYHGALIDINQSKWAFDRNGNKVYAYRSQGFTNDFNGIPFEPAVSTQVTNGVETFDMPTGVNITKFRPQLNSDVIDHIDYIFTDGSKQTASFLEPTPKAIRQMKVYFKNGIQSDKLVDDHDWYSNISLSFDVTYPDGTPIKNFDTFKVTGSFSCDELGSTGNVDVAQIMLAPTQKLTDGMMTGTNQDESNKVSNASGNFINAIIRDNDEPQCQGHLTNPIFYFKYNDLMVPDLSKISASYDNQNKELGSIGLTNIDNNKIHSSIITDSAGQKFIKVQVDGEYYYGSSPDHRSDFNVKIPIINASDALSATKDWSWYILNNNDAAKTESTIRNSGQDNKPSPVTIDGNTLSVGGKGTWQIIVAQGFTSGTETQGNLNGGPGLASTQDDHQQDPTHFNIYDSIINATNDAKSGLVSVANLPSTQDGESQFDVHMTGKASLINVMTGQAYDATITYSSGTGDNNFITGDQVTDWSKVKSIKVVPNGGASSMTSLRLVVPVEDKTIYDDVGKTIYMSTMTYGEDKTNTNYTTKDGFAVPEKSAILPIIIKPGNAASAKLTVQGQATVHTLIHYKDANGKDVYVKLADQDKIYNELQDTMKRSDYLQSDNDLTIADRGLLPTGLAINYNNPTIRNSNNTYAAGYANGEAAFDKMAKYDFDGDQVIFEGKMPEVVTKTHQAKETIHYVYRDGSTAKPDKVLTSVTLKQIGYKNPFTGEITWDSSTTDTLNSVDSPEITGYIADKLTVPSYVVTMDSPDKEVTVTYDADNETADFTYFDDTTNSTLKVVKKSGKSNTAIGYTTTDEINSYEKQGYVLVSDDTNGRNLNFDSLPTVDQHYMIHLKHKTESVTRNGNVTRTIHYLYDNGNTAKPDRTQTVSFNVTGTKDDVTGKTTWDNDDAQTVDSVTTPSITGYTPDKSSIDGQTFKFGDKDVEVTVRYSANTQTATITYIDDTTKTNLDSKDTSGKFGQAITFATAPTDEIANYKKQGYVFVSNSFDNNKYQADNGSNIFYVHLKHGTKNVSRNDDVNMTVHYVMDDNSKAPSDNKQTVNFTENGIQDLVTKHIDWTPAESQTFKDVVTPTMTGYTPDQDNVTGQTVNFGDKDVDVTVRYTANTQTATITYIDDTTKTNLKSKETSGKFGQAITFETTPTDEIENYKKQGYVLVSNTFDNNKYQADNNNNIFYVHFVHGTKNVSRNDDVNMTVHYVMDDNSEAPSDNKQSLSFTENGIQDLVTKHIDWTPAVSQTLKDVDSPVLTGYTADIKTANGKVVNFGDNDINVTVHYSANTQTATITYIDDTEKKTLGSDNQNGKFNQVIAFEHDPAEVIKGFEEKGYVFVSNSFDHQKYQADNSNNVFEVHFVHGTKDVSRSDDVNMTVHYVMDDNSEAPSDNKQTLSFTENGIQDLVTKHIDWTPAESQTFKDVVTPTMTGYTPDQDNVTGSTVNFGDKDVEVIVRYNANTQTAKITYIDDTTKTNLDSKNASGKFGQAITFATAPTDEIANYKKQGYVFVSNSFDNNKYQADNGSNIFYVHLKHGTKNVSRNDDVNMTVHYVMDDNSKAPSDNKQTVNFTENGIQDLVTKHIDWTPAESQTFKDVVTPTMTGYTADIKTANGKVVNFGDNDINVTVTYHANTQTAKITYIDDTTKTNLDSKNASGKFGQAITFVTAPADEIANYEKQGYVFVSNSFDNNKYQADNSNNVFYVHLKHGTKDVSRDSNVNMTVHYVMDDNSKAPSDNEQTVNFTENGIQDLVTKHIDWTPAESQTFKDVVTPKVAGYTPDQDNVTGSTVNFGDKDVEVTVRYNANTQNAKITYIDDTTKTNLKSQSTKGKFGQAITFETAPTVEIANYEKQGYVLVSNSFDNNKYQADNSNNVFYVHLKHGTKDVSRDSNVNMTVHYVMDDNSEAPSDNKQTLSFTENGIQDLVTKDIDWTPAESQTFKDVDSPVLTGYTPDKENVTGQTVKFGDKDVEVTVRYTANTQNAKITYIDDTTKTNLKSQNTSGKFGQAITFETTPTVEIANYKKQGYVLVSNSFDNNKYQADNSSNVFEVHLKHGNKDVSRSDDVNMTVHYVMDDNSEAPNDNKQTVNFTENGIQDLVTKHIDWTPADSQTLKDVDSPVLTGYTADIKTANGKVVNFGDPDVNVTVHYTANTQNAKITYIDDTTKTNLKSQNTKGKFGQAITFETAPTVEIANYEKQGYVLVSNSFNNNKYQADNSSNVFEVHLKHGTKKVSRDSNVNMTVHYVMDDNSKAPNDNKQAVNFTENGIQDLVTNHIDWTPAVSQTFTDVNSPVLTGYTPDQDTVTGQTVNFDDQDVEATVTYHANAQTAKITYIDDTTKTNLDSKDTSGKFGQTITFATAPADEIAKYEKQGYVFVSSTFNNNKYQADNSNNVFKVHFIHGTKKVSREHSASFTVHYIYKDGGQAKPDHEQTLSFTENGSQDLVTQKITWTPADSQKFDDVATPVITGYTPDQDKVMGQTANFETDNREVTVTYLPDVQYMTITYIDDTTGKTLHTDKRDGVSDQDAKYTTGDSIKQYEDQHYKLVSDSTKGQDLIFDHDDNVDQTYEVHFVHEKHAIDQTTSPKQTIHYVYADGLARQGKAANDNVQQLSFKRDGYNDEVTGIDHWNAWTPVNSQYEAVDSPVIQGYTPDKLVVEKSTVNPTDKDIEVIVTYSADKQAARVIYVDKTTNTTLASKDLSGKSDEDSEYNTGDKIGQYKSQHYVLFEDETNGKNVVFDHDDQQDQTYYVYFVHDTQKVNRQDTVTSTIDYKFEDGKTAQPTVTQTKYFSENGIKDLVTNKITWDEAKPQKFEDVVTEPIVGYTPDKDNVAGQTVKFGDQDIIEHIVYHNNAQKAVITYVDDVTKKTLASDSQDGKFDHEIKFNNNPSDVISGFEKSGYKLVSSNFKDGTKYKADNKQNEFIVHLTHNMQSVSRQDKVIETIHYVYEDGSKSQPDHEQTINFNETGTKDLVTGKITWDEAKQQKFEDVVTPKMTGYTPDTDNVVGSTVKFGDQDVEVTVRYTANAQTAKITYIDDTEKKTLNSDQQNGKFNQVITFEHDPAEVVKGLEEKGYQLVSDNFKPGIKYQNDNKSNIFEVHLKHKTESVTRNGAVTRTIHYLYDDGNTAKPDKIQTVSFNETGTKDDVTGKTTWDNDDAQTVDSVITPSITGYTPDKDTVAGQTFKFGDKDVEVTVRYNANAQTATITYIDDTEKKTLGSDKQNGKFNQVITFEHDPAEAIKGLEEKGYKLVSDNFKPGIKYQSDNKSNNFEIHLVHTYEPVETSQTITETVHYIDANGKSVAPDHVATVVVKVTGTRDKVTNRITWNTPIIGHFDKVLSPVVPNMTPDKKFIPSRDVQYGDSDITENVVYTLDEIPGESGNPNKPGDSTPKTPGKSNKPGDSTPKTPGKSNKSGDSTPKTPKKPNKPGNSIAKTPEKSNKSGKEVSKQRRTIVKTTIPEKHVDSCTADNQVSAKSTAKRELPQTGATINTGIWAGLASMIASLGLLGASKKRKKK